LDGDRHITFDAFPRGESLRAELGDNLAVQRIAAFSQGFYKLSEARGQLFVTDLRMGQEPFYTFSFLVAQRRSAVQAVLPPQSAGGRPEDLPRALAWLWRRALGEHLPAPR
jgi:inner membrane protein